MAGPMNPEDEHDVSASLLGAYALDAVDADERRLVEEHLSRCPRCRAEVADHLEVAGSLSSGGAPPAAVWDRIAADIAGGPPARVTPLDRARPPRPPIVAGAGRPSRPLVLGAAAAVVVLLVAIGGLTIARQQQEIDDLARAVDQQVTAVQTGRLVAPDDETTVGALVAGEQGYLLAGDLAALEPGWTYQLWAIADGQVRSLGVLGPEPSFETFEVDGDVTTLAITREQVPGAAQPTSDPLVVGELA